MKNVAIAVAMLTLGCSANGAPCPTAPPAPAAPTPSAAPTSLSKSTSATSTNVDSVRETMFAAINARDARALDALFSANMKKVLPLEKLEKWLPAILDAKGRLGTATVEADSPSSARHAVYRVKAEKGEWRVELTVADDGTILGLSFTAPLPADPPVATSRDLLELALPFRGEWKVVWGGASEAVNQHVRHKSQRRAADLVKVDGAGKTHKNEGKDLRDYFAYGQELLAPADGKVAYVIDGVPDSAPGTLNGYSAVGNVVVIEHVTKTERPLYSMVAHLVPGSVRVKAGAPVKRGQVLGACGNSGNSSEPHLHFQVMDGPRVESSFGIEPVFGQVTVVRQGQRSTEAAYTFLKDDVVASQLANAAAPRQQLDTKRRSADW